MTGSFTKDDVKPGIARAWFDTVLNPIIGALRTEAALLEKGDLSWRKDSQKLVGLDRVRDHVLPEAWDNLDQFVSVYPDLNARIREHDQNLDLLNVLVAALYTQVAQSPAVLDLLRKYRSDLTEQDQNLSEEEIVASLAEYMINNLDHLPGYYSTSRFWNRHSIEFLKLREDSPLREHWEPVATSGKALLEAAEQLATALASLRNDLSFALDVPIVASRN